MCQYTGPWCSGPALVLMFSAQKDLKNSKHPFDLKNIGDAVFLRRLLNQLKISNFAGIQLLDRLLTNFTRDYGQSYGTIPPGASL
jgi:hypothetical protein